MDVESSDNASGAVNQQERLESYIAGFIDGEGCFHVAIQRNPSTRSGWQLVPEFRISQDVARVKVLDLARRQMGCGLLRENHRGSNDHTYVLVVRRRQDLLERVIPFFERNPLLSCKQDSPPQLRFQNPQRPYAEHSHRRCEREDMARSAWRHAEPGRNVLAPDFVGGNRNVGPYPMQP